MNNAPCNAKYTTRVDFPHTKVRIDVVYTTRRRSDLRIGHLDNIGRKDRSQTLRSRAMWTFGDLFCKVCFSLNMKVIHNLNKAIVLPR